jgi:hypothetical protein
MSESQLGSGENIYAALEAGYGVVPEGPLEGVPLHAPRLDPNWHLPKNEYHIAAPWSDTDAIKQHIDASLAEAKRTGGTDIPQDIFERLYARSQVISSDNLSSVRPKNSAAAAGAYDSSYVIKGFAFNFPYQMQQVIERNTARAIVGSYREPDLPNTYPYTLIDKLHGWDLYGELGSFFEAINYRFSQRKDQSNIGTNALADEIERLMAQVMNDRWAAIALPSGDYSESAAAASTATSAKNETVTPDLPTQEEVTVAFEDLVANIGSERILQWSLGSGLDELGRYVIGLSPSSGDQNPYDELRDRLLAEYKATSDKPIREELRERIEELQALGDIRSRYNRRAQ